MSSSPVVDPPKNRKVPEQPIDRHLSEIEEFDGTVYINAGIDSTCCRKRPRTIYTLTNGIVVASYQATCSRKKALKEKLQDDLLRELNNENANEPRFDIISEVHRPK